MIYPDTSALVSLFVVDAHSEAARAAFSAARELRVADLGIVELSAVLSAAARNRAFEVAVLDALFVRIDRWVATAARLVVTVAGDVETATGFVRRPDLGLRAPDAIHLAICRRLGATLLTYDQRQAAAATVLGIRLA